MCVRMTIRRPFLVRSSLRAADATTRGDWSVDCAASPEQNFRVSWAHGRSLVQRRVDALPWHSLSQRDGP